VNDMKHYQILVINLGSSSTKVAYYLDDECIIKDNLIHATEELKKYGSIWEQTDMRREAIEKFLVENNIEKEKLDAVVSRGGHTRPLAGGAYLINDVMLQESASGKFGNHACDLGLVIAKDFSKYGAKPITAYTPVTDEFGSLARYTGLPEMQRQSRFHALNHKGVAKHYARVIGRAYEDMNLIIVHMGGGISVAAHEQGKMIDANNALDGDGPFSTNRTGGLPAGSLIAECFSGKYSEKEMMMRINGQGGTMAYLGENDILKVENRADAGDQKCAEILEAMSYQIAKEIGACAAVLSGHVDAIILTGGMANSERITEFITKRVSFIAPVVKYPGEYEMQSLAENALEVLRGMQKLLLIK
jgi:butyrate kinase